VDGWVSLEVSPLLAHDTKSTVAEAKNLHARAQRPNLLIKIPGTKEGLPAIEEAIFRRHTGLTSRCCSPPTNTLRPPTHSCAALNAASTPDCHPM